jgi:hypothetical protein
MRALHTRADASLRDNDTATQKTRKDLSREEVTVTAPPGIFQFRGNMVGSQIVISMTTEVKDGKA